MLILAVVSMLLITIAAIIAVSLDTVDEIEQPISGVSDGVNDGAIDQIEESFPGLTE